MNTQLKIGKIVRTVPVSIIGKVIKKRSHLFALDRNNGLLILCKVIFLITKFV